MPTFPGHQFEEEIMLAMFFQLSQFGQESKMLAVSNFGIFSKNGKMLAVVTVVLQGHHLLYFLHL